MDLKDSLKLYNQYFFNQLSFRYYELKEKDCLKFAFSSREYVLLHDKTDTSLYDEASDESSDSD